MNDIDTRFGDLLARDIQLKTLHDQGVEINRLKAIEMAARGVVQSLREDGWDETEYPCLREGLSALMRLFPAARTVSTPEAK